MATESTTGENDRPTLPLLGNAPAPAGHAEARDDDDALLSDREVISLFAGGRRPSRLRLALRRLRRKSFWGTLFRQRRRPKVLGLNFAMDRDLFFALNGYDERFTAYGMEDTDGLQYCRNINRLNLSHNRISNLYDLQDLVYLNELLLSDNRIEEIEYLAGLENLEILDLSFNEVEDIKPLLSLDRLQFADLRGNPLRSRTTMRKLTQRGVVVLY